MRAFFGTVRLIAGCDICRANHRSGSAVVQARVPGLSQPSTDRQLSEQTCSLDAGLATGGLTSRSTSHSSLGWTMFSSKERGRSALSPPPIKLRNSRGFSSMGPHLVAMEASGMSKHLQSL